MDAVCTVCWYILCMCVCEQRQHNMDVHILHIQRESTVALQWWAGNASSYVPPNITAHAGEHTVSLSVNLSIFMLVCLPRCHHSPLFPHQQECQYLLLYLYSADEEQTFALDPTLYVSLCSIGWNWMNKQMFDSVEHFLNFCFMSTAEELLHCYQASDVVW